MVTWCVLFDGNKSVFKNRFDQKVDFVNCVLYYNFNLESSYIDVVT